MKKCLFIFLILLYHFARAQDSSYTLLIPARVFDGDSMHNGWQVLIKGNIIQAAGDPSKMNIPARR